jgi:hypothetical protein
MNNEMRERLLMNAWGERDRLEDAIRQAMSQTLIRQDHPLYNMILDSIEPNKPK